jgi:prolyl-tRNA synthetase
MRQSRLFAPTLREVPAEAEVASHQWMLRAGMIRQLASGIYTYLPLGKKVLQKVENIVREEMNRAGAQELLMPAIQPAELWLESGRWDVYGPELMRLKDRHDRGFALGPTHEEVITTLIRDNVRSYKRLPLNLYQIQTKYRDERRPRFGLLRGREFIMKDAYSFDIDFAGLDESYQTMYDAYTRVFIRCGVNFRPVEADSGAIGGEETHEFMVLADIGENTIVYCTSCNYAANLEMAEVKNQATAKSTSEPTSERLTKERIFTGDHKTIEEVSSFLKVDPHQIIKTLIYHVDDKAVAVLVRGDEEVNEVKVRKLFGAEMVELADANTVKELTGTSVGTVGPIGLNLPIVADHSVKGAANVVIGANEENYHHIYVAENIDFEVSQFADLRNIKAGDACPRCGGAIDFTRGIEVGQVFKLGTKYSNKLGARYLDEQGREQDFVMGCYGIGVSRTVAAAIEQNHDENGIVWPVPLAPYDVHIVPVNAKDENQMEVAERLYIDSQEKGFDPLLDDRPERAGVKFKDSDIIGLPIRITVGAKAVDGIVELKVRKTGESKEIPVEEVWTEARNILNALV